ncbi:MinD/ParA family protein [Tissierella sp.]|uniref:MinD/ParA family protein n=1 Tax=Tissierella sp. TaxID=41274 RepID=UPI0028621C6C|nr:MinD/ParA family protein [Tissierella sp.]MDR7856250.1 MinD/ParA family protein [Tissierella sp.]
MDQADKLRKIMNTNIIKDEENLNKENKAKVISISSGKGGVGKTNFAINFSISLSRLNYKVVIIDADIGLSNIEILAGVNMNYTLADIVLSDKTIFDIMGNGPEGIKIISGGSGLKELKLFDNDNILKLMKEIENLQSTVDYIIIDTGAGISPAVTDFIMTSSELIVVCTPDPTSLMDSYTLIKSVIHTEYKGHISVVTNLVSGRNEGKEIYTKLSNTSNNFLGVQVDYLGYIERNELVTQGIRNQIPFTVSHPNSPISKRINTMAMNFLDNQALVKKDIKLSFAKKIFDIFSRRGD